MSGQKKVLVTGAGGFIGHHLVRRLKQDGFWVRGADIKKPEFERTIADDFRFLDLRDAKNCLEATEGMDEVYALAADMGGMGFISKYHAQILHNNILINVNTIEAAKANKVDRYLFTSSACVYPEYKQSQIDAVPLKEEDAYPAQPQDAYGWEKLVSERLCMHYRLEHGLKAHVVRFHNIFGPLCAWRGGREKAPAAICRKIAVAKLTNKPEIEIWGDGKQTRSFCYIDDCIEGLVKLMKSEFYEPLNLGQDRLISIDGLVDVIADIAGIKIRKKHIKGPEGVRGRNSDNTLLRKILNWEPRISLEEGLKQTYNWIKKEIKMYPNLEYLK